MGDWEGWGIIREFWWSFKNGDILEMGTSKPHIKLKSDNNANDTHMAPKENEQPEINEKTESANSSLKKIEENAAKNNDTAEQEEIKQTDVVAQKKLFEHLEIISKLLGILTILGTITGGFFIYSYLEKIEQLSIFSDVITNLSALIATTIIFAVILLLFCYHSLLAFLIGIKFKTIKKIEKWYISILSFILIFIWIDYIILSKHIKESILLILAIFSICVLSLASFLLGYNKLFRRNIQPLYLLFFYSIFVGTSSLILDKFFLFESIHFVRFAETPKNSSWYLLHNNFQKDNGFQETNGINKSDLKELKRHFYKSNLCTKKELKEHTLQYYSTLASRENALYGYMAWNLGDTKVFCPSYVNNKFSNINNQITDNCIVISGKALQIMPEGYISTESIQQPKHDAKE